MASLGALIGPWAGQEYARRMVNAKPGDGSADLDSPEEREWQQRVRQMEPMPSPQVGEGGFGRRLADLLYRQSDNVMQPEAPPQMMQNPANPAQRVRSPQRAWVRMAAPIEQPWRDPYWGSGEDWR